MIVFSFLMNFIEGDVWADVVYGHEKIVPEVQEIMPFAFYNGRKPIHSI
jgi:hypothetical protein